MWKQPEASSLHLTKMVSYPDRSASNADSPNTVCKTFLSAKTIFKETPVELIHKLQNYTFSFSVSVSKAAVYPQNWGLLFSFLH